MKNPSLIITFLMMSFMLSCGVKERQGGFEMLNKTPDGKLTLIDQTRERLLVVSANNRIDDVVDLNISKNDIDKIRKNKEIQDNATKIKTWPKMEISGTNYIIVLSTRYYKDKMLYSIDFKPYDTLSAIKSSTISINMNDENGFTLERIVPMSWARIVDEQAKPYAHRSNGSVTMSLENYLEITHCSPLWR